MKRYDKLVPSDSFMGHYLTYMQNQETAYAFDWWSGLYCISAACGRNTIVARPRAPVYLNMYCILVGESGVARKTTSVTSVTRILRPVLAERGVVSIMDSKVTPEMLDETLHTHTMDTGSAQLCIAIPELAVFLGVEAYTVAMPTLLTDLYDCPTFRHGGGTLIRGECVQRNVWVSVLSASTPIWLLKSVNPRVVEGGFTSRCLFIVSNQPKRSIPWPAPDMVDLVPQLQDYLRVIRDKAEKQTGITLNQLGLSMFSSWYGTRIHSPDPFMQSFEAREDAHVLRVAALMSINDGTWLINERHVGAAIGLVEEVKQSSGSIFENGEQATKFAMGLDLLRSVLISAGMDPVPRHKLFFKLRTRLDNTEFLSLIEVLHEIGAVQRFTVAPEGKGRATEYIRGTNLLLSSGLGETVLDHFH